MDFIFVLLCCVGRSGGAWLAGVGKMIVIWFRFSDVFVLLNCGVWMKVKKLGNSGADVGYFNGI